jgi:hypothetical protein
MAQRVIAFFLLLLHINGSMLLPQVDETDAYCNGEQVDDINSFVEYFEQEVLDIPDDTPEDEDDDKGQEFRLLQVGSDICEHKIQSTLLKIPVTEKQNNSFRNPPEKILAIHFDILTPPPRV